MAPLLELGVIGEVVRPLLSGKEAQIYLVRATGELRVAKVYKDSQQRSFKHRSQYSEGRKVRNTRDQRAIAKGSRYGKAQVEAAWKSTEVDVIYRLRSAGVRVPEPFAFTEGVLVMELVTDAGGNPAPRLGEVQLSHAAAQELFDQLLREVVRMLCAGVVHGDLSDYNVLLAADGPVIIDFPQAIDAASNQNAERILIRDVNNLHRFLSRHDRHARRLPYGQEIWAAYERGELTPDYQLTGKHTPAPKKIEANALLDEITELHRQSRERRRALGLEDERDAYVIQPVTEEELRRFAAAKARPRAAAKTATRDTRPEKSDRSGSSRKRGRQRGPVGAKTASVPAARTPHPAKAAHDAPHRPNDASPSKKRRRRRSRRGRKPDDKPREPRSS